MFLIEYMYYFSSDENDVVSADQALLVFLFFYLEESRSWSTGVSSSKIAFGSRSYTKTSQKDLPLHFPIPDHLKSQGQGE